MIAIFEIRGLRAIIENPYSGQTYLKDVLRIPDIVDKNRMLRGDFFIKPTAYWFYNFLPTNQFSLQKDKKTKNCMGEK